jgi:hypothetical protein
MKIQKTQRVVLVQSGSHHHLIENYGIKQQSFIHSRFVPEQHAEFFGFS